MRIAVLGLGEAGALYAEALAASSRHVAGFDPAAAPTPAGVRRAASVADAVSGAEFVIGLAGAAAAADVAREAALTLSAHACYADFSSAAPGTKREVARAVARAVVADVALLAPVPRRGVATPLLVSGPGASRVAEIFVPLGAEVEVLQAPVGAAAERKLLRSVFMKGLAATVLEAVTAGAAAGCEQWVRDQIADEIGHGLVDRLIDGTRTHAARRRHEVMAARDHLAALGAPAEISDATLAWLTRLTDIEKER
jgi:3-hydroxyisobutyrate dehydrogenase